MAPVLIRRTQSGRVDFVFVLYGGSRKTYKLAVAMPMPGKLLWSVTLCDPTRESHRRDPESATQRASFETKEESGASFKPYLGPFVPNGSQCLGIKTIPGRGWYRHCRIYAPRSSRSIVDGARATIAIR
jgi:hypothetical protein